VQYEERTAPECRGRLRTDREGKYGYRAIVPVPYFIPDEVSRNCSMPFCVSDGQPIL
jgi:protocatechuate 3,4-dioxygenase beta subunit